MKRKSVQSLAPPPTVITKFTPKSHNWGTEHSLLSKDGAQSKRILPSLPLGHSLPHHCRSVRPALDISKASENIVLDLNNRN